MTLLTRRSILFGLITAPVVVRMGLIMPVRVIELEEPLILTIPPGIKAEYLLSFAPNRQSDYATYDPYENDGWGINWPVVSGARA